jgi:hypothetical protein
MKHLCIYYRYLCEKISVNAINNCQTLEQFKHFIVIYNSNPALLDIDMQLHDIQ